MLTQCPSCHARARTPGDLEGDKVRCAECGRVYVARASGARSRSSRRLLALLAGGLAFALALLVVLWMMRGHEGSPGTLDRSRGEPSRAPALAGEDGSGELDQD